MKTHYIILLAIAILAGVWTAGVITGAARQYKRDKAEFKKLEAKIEALRDSDLKTRINVGYLQYDVKKLQQAAK